MKLLGRQPHFPDIEQQILKSWSEENIFQQSLEKNRDGKPFVFFEGPPTANGRPGIHHVIGRVYKDFILRYQNMRGRLVERKAGWDTHGLPVELQVEKQLGLKSKKEIEAFGIERFNEECRRSVWTYKDEWERLTARTGFWIDMTDPYITYENRYIESVWWALFQIWNTKTSDGQPLFYKSHRVVPFCPRCGTALSSHELAQGYKVVNDPSVFVKFKVRDQENTFLLAWTTTPWTLPGNVALAVGKDITYVKVKSGDDVLILAKERLDAVTASVEVLEEISGAELVDLAYEPLFPPMDASKKGHVVLSGDFVTTQDGTGIVHLAWYGDDDYRMIQQYDLPRAQHINEEGRYVGPNAAWKGMWFKDLDPAVLEDLRARGLLFRTAAHEHDYPFCWRCSTSLIYLARESWYIRMSALRDQLITQNQTVHWVPEHIKEGRFGEWLNEIKDWAISRQRYWGTPIPVWECDQCHEARFMNGEGFEQALSEIRKQLPKDDYHRPFIDAVTFPCACGGTMHRILDVLDVWFDSGAMPYAQWHYPFEHRDRVDAGKSFPADYITEAIDQTRGWFYTLLAVAIALGKPAPYRHVICYGHVLDAMGQKMSKSKGNIVDPWMVIEKYGADPLRWLFYTMNQPGESKLFDVKMVEEIVKKQFLILWNVCTFYQMFVESGSAQEETSLHVMDRWLLAKMSALVGEVTRDLDAYNMTSASRKIAALITDLSTWYLRRSRNRFKSNDPATRAAAVATLGQVLKDLIRLLAPFTPFLADYLYRALDGEKASVHLEDWPTEKRTVQDETLLGDMDLVREIVRAGLEDREQKKMPVRQALSMVRVVGAREISAELQEVLKEELNVEAAAWDPKGVFHVEVDPTLTPELEAKGLVRLLTRQVSALRKQAGLAVGDQILLTIQASSEIQAMLTPHLPAFQRSVFADSIQWGTVTSAHQTTVAVKEDGEVVLGF
jgi:isoleucyl-tRNA synthetase